VSEIHKSKALVTCALVVSIVAAGAAMALLTTRKTISGSGSIKGVAIGVYWDLECTNVTSSLNFGMLEPGSSTTFTLYLENEGNSALTLNMTSKNWNPANATDYMTLTWNREGQLISLDEVMDFAITLSVSEDITGISTYSFDIVVSGTG
jgi:hypothetical protein